MNGPKIKPQCIFSRGNKLRTLSIGLQVGVLLFIALNWAIASLFQYDQRLEGKRYQGFNTFDMFRAANNDPHPIKVFFLGNSVQQQLLDFKFLQSRLEKIVKHDIQVYNLAVMGSSPVDYQVILSQLPTSESTLVVMPIFSATFSSEWPPFRTDLDALLAKPSVIKALGYDYYRKNVSGSQLWSSFLKLIFPVYKYRYLVKYLFQKAGYLPWDDTNRQWALNIAMAKASWGMIIPERVEMFFRQFERILDKLKDRGVPHFTYIQPSNKFDRKKYAGLLSRVRNLLIKREVPWSDISTIWEESEFKDFWHPWAFTDRYQFLGLVESLDKVTPRQVKRLHLDFLPDIIILKSKWLDMIYDMQNRERVFDIKKANPKTNSLSEINKKAEYFGTRVYTLDVDLSNPVRTVERIIVGDSVLASQEDADESLYKMKNGFWMIRNGIIYMLVTSKIKIEPSVESVTVVMGDIDEYPSGPLADAVRKIDHALSNLSEQ